MVVEDSNDSPSLMIVLSGTVELSQKNFDTGVPTKIHKAHVAGVLCQLQTLTNEPSFFTVKAIAKDTKVSLICFFIDFFTSFAQFPKSFLIPFILILLFA